MHIESYNLNGTTYLRLAESYSASEGGKTKQKKRSVYHIGPMHRFDDGAPNYLERLRKSFRQGNPLIPALLPYVNSQVDRVTIEFDRNSIDESTADYKNIGYFLLDGLFDSLGINSVLTQHKSRKKITWDLVGLAKLLVISRVLRPASKIATFKEKDNYLLPLTDSEDWHQIYNCLDELDAKSEAIQKRMNLRISQMTDRRGEITYYDVTNYFFEIENNDEDLQDESGNLLKKGLRKKGVCKHNRRTPIVQMGMFLDEQGVPVSFHLFPGNTLDQVTLRPAMKKSIDQYDLKRLIIVADRGLTSNKNLAHILEQGNGYVFSKSIKKSTKSEREWVLDQTGYQSNADGSFKVKSKIVTKTILTEDGRSIQVREKILCYWSRKFYRRELKENQSFLKTLQKYIDDPASIKAEKGKLKQFIQETVVDEATGEILKPKTVRSINLEKAMEYNDLMGYYMIVSSEIDKSEEELIDIYRGLTRIEDSFRIIKSDLKARPIFVNLEEHINAHFLICFIALTMMRLMQNKIVEFTGASSKSAFDWEAGLSAKRIQKALNRYKVTKLPKGYYLTSKLDEDLELLLDAMDVRKDLRLPTLSEIKQYRFEVRKKLMD